MMKRVCFSLKSLLVLLFLLFSLNLLAQLPKPVPAKSPKYVILMIGDGMGYSCVEAARYFYGPLQIDTFPVKLAIATYPAALAPGRSQGKNNNPVTPGYDTSLAWKDTAYLRKNVTESSAAATALATGFKTTNQVLGLSPGLDTLMNLCELAKSMGKSAGVISTVPFSHATPAAFSVHNRNRSNYSEIAAAMLFSSRCDLIMGCGNPEFDDNARDLGDNWKSSKYVADSLLWLSLKSGSGIQTSFLIGDKVMVVKDVSGDRIPDPWTLVSSRTHITKLMSGKTPKRLLAVPEVHSTLQQGREKGKLETKDSPPGTAPANKGVPSLAEMTKAGLNVLDNNRKGFFLMIEGGAIDWANHSRQKGRMLEEMKSFSDAVDAVIEWVEKNSGWDETLLIVTADHECGDLWGYKPFTPVTDKGRGVMPGLSYNYGSHTNALVGLWATGRGSEMFENVKFRMDPVRGKYIDNTDVPRLIFRLWGKDLTF